MTNSVTFEEVVLSISAELAAQRALISFLAGVLHGADVMTLEEMADALDGIPAEPSVRVRIREIASQFRAGSGALAAGRSAGRGHLRIVNPE